MGKPVHIDSLAKYVKYLEKRCQKEGILFRGQGRADQVLIPRIARLALKADIIDTEYEMLDDFKRQAIPYIELTPENDWEWLAVAQHNRMATRLLDWTWNPLAALWFAVEKPPAEGIDGVVWTFTARDDEYIEDLRSSPLEQHVTRVYEPSNVVPRITAQGACFTVHGYDKKTQSFIPLEQDRRYKKLLTKLLIDGNSFHGIRYQLDRCGINSSSLFPDIEGLCRHVEWSHSLLSDE